MRSTAKVEEFALLVNRDDAVLRQGVDQLQFVWIAKLAENAQRFRTAHFLADDREVLADNAFHFLLDLLQILRIQRLFQVHVIIEAVFDDRPHAKLDFFLSIQTLGCLSQQMRCTVAHHLKPFGRILRNDFDQRSVLKRSG